MKVYTDLLVIGYSRLRQFFKSTISDSMSPACRTKNNNFIGSLGFQLERSKSKR